MPAWAYLAGLWVAKKAVALGLGAAYGWPRVYRRVMEANRRVNGTRDTDEYRRVRDAMQYAMRVPGRWKQTLQSDAGLRRVLESVEGARGAVASATGAAAAKPPAGAAPKPPPS